MINSRDINDLHPLAAAKCRKFIELASRDGIDIIITSTYRDNAAQAALYAKGRTASGKIVTNAKPGESFHNYRIAFDFAPIKNGKIPWDDPAIWERCGIIAENAGLEWAGRWKSFREMAHCQLPGFTIAELKNGKTIG